MRIHQPLSTHRRPGDAARRARHRRRRDGAPGAAGAPRPDPADPRLARPAAARRPGGPGHGHPVSPPGGGPGGAAEWRGHPGVDAHRLRQVAVLPPAGAPGDRGGPIGTGAVPVPDQGAQPRPAGRGPGAGRPGGPATPGGRLRRRYARRRSGAASGPPARSWSPTRTCSTPRSCPTTRRGSSCSSSCATSWWTRRTPTGASSAAMSRTCCGGWPASAPTTAPRPGSCAARRPSAIPAELARTLTGRQVRVIDRNGAPSGEKHVVVLDPPVLDSRTGARPGPVRAWRAGRRSPSCGPAARPSCSDARGSRWSCC